jgi:cytoskeletal protein CcmA (bactofilin family)
MADNFSVPDTKSITSEPATPGCAYFGEGVTFKGSITVPEKIVVHGSVEGDVKSRQLFVGPKGIIKGSVFVDEADVQGRIIENIEAKVCLTLRKSGVVEGKATYGEIEIEKGGVLSGTVSSNKTEAPALQPVFLKKDAASPSDIPQIIGTSQSDTVTKFEVKKDKFEKKEDFYGKK